MRQLKEQERKTKLMLMHKLMSKSLIKPNKVNQKHKVGFKKFVIIVE